MLPGRNRPYKPDSGFLPLKDAPLHRRAGGFAELNALGVFVHACADTGFGAVVNATPSFPIHGYLIHLILGSTVSK